jgi:cellulose synthase/poly-beta-1,6-N-acetylglucosamine synthase-like glycosyltransferase
LIGQHVSLWQHIVAWHGPLLWRHVSWLWRDALEWGAWGLALLWLFRISDAIRYLPHVALLTGFGWDIEPEGTPRLTVVVPARNEAEKIAATLDALMLADYAGLQVVAVDDRSTDATGTIMEAYALEYGNRLRVLHIEDLPDGWLGKVFALSVATDQSEGEYVLYTDADVVFSPSILRRAVAYAQAVQADHLVVMPTMQVKSRGEGIVLGFFQIFGLWASRPWKVEDPGARRDVIGVGAFNLVRRTALEELGGWGPQRLAIVEDITLGRRMKAAGMRQRVAFAPGLVLVHWAKGARGLVRGMTKNLFSAFNFEIPFLLFACAWVSVFFLLPLLGLLWWNTLTPALLVLASIGAAYRTMGELSEIDARYAWLYPLGAAAFVLAMLRSMLVVTWQRGVMWRGTFYELRDLRKHNSPLVWEREARRLREEKRRGEKAAIKKQKRDLAEAMRKARREE